MLTISEIRDNCFDTTYSKGKQLFDKGAFRHIDIGPGDEDYGEEVEEIRGLVEGSGARWYEVNVGILQEDNSIEYYECQCPAYEKYYGMCKHCVALALLYRSRQRDAQTTAEAVKAAGKRSVKSRAKRATSTALMNMMNQYGHRGKGYILEHYDHEIDFVPEFRRAYNGALEVEFKIGGRKKYVVKNIAAVIDAVDRVVEFSYGKNLSFIHDRTVFKPEALEWIDIMKDIMSTIYKIDNYESYNGTYYNNTFRTISLGSYGTQRCLEHYLGSTIVIDGTEYEVVDADPKLTLVISNQDNEGATLSVAAVKGFQGNRYTYIMNDGKIYQCSEAYSQDALPVLKAMRALQIGPSYAGAPLYLSAEDYRLFCKNLLPMIEPYFDIQLKDVDFEEYKPENAQLQVYLEMTEGDAWCIEAHCKAVYGETAFDVFNDAQQAVQYRDIDLEYDLRRQIYVYFKPVVLDGSMRLFCDEEEDILNLVQEGIARISEIAEVFVDEKIRGIQLKPSPKITIGVSIKSGLLELDIGNDLMHPEEIVSVLGAYRKRRKYFRLKNGDIIRLDNENLALLSELGEGLMLKDGQLADGKVTVPKFRVNYIDDAIRRLSGNTDVHRNAQFRKMVRGMREFSDSDFDVPDTVRAKLRKYQTEGFRWLATLAAYGLGGVLADDMGLGKTLQMLSYIALAKPKTLIVCPASLVYNWESEIHRFVPSLKAIAVTGGAAARERLLEGDAADADITVTSYDLLKRDVDIYSSKKYDCMVIDEAQYIKNAGTLAAKAVKSVDAAARFALTGTPIENRLSDLWSIFDFIMPGYLYTYSKFKEEFEQPIVNDGDEKVLARIRDMVTPFILRRRKKDVLKDLPDKLEETVYTKMSDAQEQIYRAMASRLTMELSKTSDESYQHEKIRFLAELTRLRQVCCAPDLCYEDYKGGSGKMDACMDLLDSAVSGGHKVLVFSQFTQMLEMLIKAWEGNGGSYLYLSGKNTKEQRRWMVDQFQNGDIPVFFISLKAGGTGLNLTAADMVIHYDPWWNVAAQNQATDRTHRIGQKNVVTVMKLVTKDTIEEKILKLQEEKAKLAENVIEGKAASDSRISREDLLELLK